MINANEIKIERVIMSGKGPRVTYKLVYNSITMFQTASNGYIAWTRKKDAKLIIDRIQEYGLSFVESKLNLKAFK